MYEVIKSCGYWFAPKSLSTKFLSTETAIHPGPNNFDTVEQVAMNNTNAMGETPSYLAAAMFNALHNLLRNSQIICIEWQWKNWNNSGK